MNRVILNNTFKIVFGGVILAVALVPVFYFNLYPKYIFWGFVFSFLIYTIGVFWVTVLGNIPLNEKLDKTNLDSIGLEEINALRERIEVKWNKLNLIRSIPSAISFVILTFSFLFFYK